MRTLLIGARGQLGTALRALLTGEVVAPARAEFDLGDESAISAFVSAARPDTIINAAAYNLVDRAEDEPIAAFSANAFAVRTMAIAAEAAAAVFVHISTDYVFGLDSARQTPWREDDAPGPVGVYGASKLAGEHFARVYCTRHFVLRTCGLYGRADSPGKGNFVATMLRLGRERGAVSVVDDQYCTPTSAADLAKTILALVATRRYGLYHATNSGSTTWCGLAREVFRRSGLAVDVTPITTAQFRARARRPAYSVLDGDRIAGVLGARLPSWQDALARYLHERGDLQGG